MDIGLFAVCLIVGSMTEGAPLLLHELSILACAVLTIFGDEFLSNNLGLVLYGCFGVLFTFHLVILYSAAVPKPKPSAGGKTFEQARDTDLEFDDEITVAVSRQTNFLQQRLEATWDFYKFRPVYGILTLAGFLFLVSCYVIRTLPVGDENLRKDLHSASMELIMPAIVLISVPLFIANTGVYVSDNLPEVYSYRPFQKYIQVPMKVVAGKFLTTVVTYARMNLLSTLFVMGFMALTACSLLFIYHLTDEDRERMQAKYGMRIPSFMNVVPLLTTLLLGTAVVGCLLLGGLIVPSWHKTKRCLFGIIERNFRRNLRAVEYLLPDVEGQTLEDLQEALESKRSQPLTEREKRAFNYIGWPLWQTKQPFVAVPREQPILERQVDEQPQQPRNDEQGGEQNVDGQQAAEGGEVALLPQAAEGEVLYQPPPEFADNRPGQPAAGEPMFRRVFRMPARIRERRAEVPEVTPPRRSKRLRQSVP